MPGWGKDSVEQEEEEEDKEQIKWIWLFEKCTAEHLTELLEYLGVTKTEPIK